MMNTRGDKPFKEWLYDHIRIPIRVLDVIIWLLALAAVFLIIYGAMQGN